AELLDYVARVHARPLDRTKPLWETYLIEGLAGSRVALYSKVHHAMIDGISGINLATILLDNDPHGTSPPPSRPFRPGPLPSPSTLIADPLLERGEGAARALRSVAEHPVDVPRSVAGQLGSLGTVRQLAAM